MSGYKELSYFVDGKLIVIERFEDEIDPQYAERASFILSFRNDPEKFALAKTMAHYHTQKMFSGVVYSPKIEALVKQLRDERLAIQ